MNTIAQRIVNDLWSSFVSRLAAGDAARPRVAAAFQIERDMPIKFVGLCILCWGCFGSPSFAGLGPENTIIVVNSARVDSMTVANHYAEMRQIPSSNMIYLRFEDVPEYIKVEKFREQILKPILREIEKRRLTDQIDAIIYSAGFPYAIDFRRDLPNGQTPHPTTGILGSITGMTYLAELVLAKDLNYLFTLANTRCNYYDTTYRSDTVGFRHSTAWSDAGTPGPNGRRYYLSAMLGYTDGRGNTLDEVLRYLKRASLADGTKPSGTVYLMKNSDVRSKTRDGIFPRVAAALVELGISTRIIEDDAQKSKRLPTGATDMMGAVLGMDKIPWARSNCQIMPGAIVENLTSFGGDLSADGTQTPLTETLKYGAAGSSGTVMEPFALQAKFPHPWIQVHYGRGASLAEAFYRSISSPYQLLVVGDPLCRPWANIPQVDVQGLQPNQTVAGTVKVTPRPVSPVPVAEFRLYFDGRLVNTCQPGESFELDTLKVADGHHELRVVAIEDSPIQSQGRLLVPFTVDNNAQQIRVVARPNVSSIDESVRLHVSSDKAQDIFVFHHRNLIKKIKGAKGEVAVGPEVVGRGPVEIYAVARRGKNRVFSVPVQVVVSGQQAAPFGNRGTGLGNVPPILRPVPAKN